MTLASAIYSYLTANVAIAALVGTRVYPVTAPQVDDNAAVEPMIVYALQDRAREYSFSGAAMTRDAWLFVAAAADYDTAHSVADALITALDHLNHTVMPSPSGVLVQHITLRTTQDIEDAFELGIFQVAAEFEFVY